VVIDNGSLDSGIAVASGFAHSRQFGIAGEERKHAILAWHNKVAIQ